MDDVTDSQWHKALVLCLHKLGIVEILITDNDMRPFLDAAPDKRMCAIIDQQSDGLHVRIATVEQAREYAAMAQASQAAIVRPN